MKYVIEFDLPDNDTVLNNMKTALVGWNIWGYSGSAHAKPKQPERKTGKWIYEEKDGQDGWYCSECEGFIPWDYDYYGLNNIDFIKDFKTCPFCDTKMISYTGMKEGANNEPDK